jgi:cytochrome c-type biogenesis protein CcmH/NrfG
MALAHDDFASAAASYRRGLKLEPGNAEAQRRLAAITGLTP